MPTSQSNVPGLPRSGRSPVGRIVAALGQIIDYASLSAHRRSGKAVVFLYHRVSAAADAAYPPTHPGEFDRHCDFIGSEFTVVSLVELSERAVQGRSLAGLAAISFDDGYFDFISDAYPVLRRRSLPCTHFLVEDCLRTGLPPWNLRVRHISPGHPLPPHMRLELARLGAVERGRWLQEREAAAKPGYPQMIRPADLASVDPALVSWQCHTASHPVLTESPASEIDRELVGARAAIAEWTGSAVNLLS